jgi:hypothetical protein
MTPMDKASVAVGYPPLLPSTAHKRALRPGPYSYGERNPCVTGNPVSHPQNLRTECMDSRLTQLRKSVISARRSQCGVPQLRCGARPRFVERGYPPQKLSSPSPSLYMDMGMVMMPKKGVPRDVQWAGSRGQQARQSPSLWRFHSAFRNHRNVSGTCNFAPAYHSAAPKGGGCGRNQSSPLPFSGPFLRDPLETYRTPTSTAGFRSTPRRSPRARSSNREPPRRPEGNCSEANTRVSGSLY